MTVNLARLLGPAAAGLIILHLDITWVFALNAIVTLLFVWVLTRLKLVARNSAPAQGGFFGLMREGFVYVVRTPRLQLALGMLFLGGVVVRSMLELAPAIAALTFSDSTTGLAVLMGAAGLGAMVSGLTVRGRNEEHLLQSVVFWWSFGALAAMALTQAPVAPLAILAVTLLGAAISRGMIGAQTLVQLTTPDALLGRVLSVHGLVARSSPALGALAIGYAADRFGLPATVAFSSLIFLLIALLVLLTGRSGKVW